MQQTDETKESEEDSTQAETESKPSRPGHVNIVQAVIGAVILLAGSLMLLHVVGSYWKGYLALQYKSTDAVVENVVEHFDPFSVRKEVQLSFKVNGTERKAIVPAPDDRVMKRGELTSAFYDEANPSNAVLTQEIDDDTVVVIGAFGMLFFCIGALLSIKSVRRASTSVDNESIEESIESFEQQ